MKRPWPLRKTKARLSELVRAAEVEGPQQISVRGEPVAIVISCRDYARLVGTKTSFLGFLQGSPLAGVQIKARRDKSPARRLSL